MAEYIFGRNPVMEALRGERAVVRIILSTETKPAPVLTAIEQTARQKGISVTRQPKRNLDRLAGHEHHQGVLAETSEFDYVELEDVLGVAEQRGEPPLLLVLDTVQDPQNLGTLLRTAEAVGTHGIVIPRHRAAAVTPAVVRSSAGATEHLQIARVTNLTRALDALKQQNIWIVGIEAGGSQSYDEVDLDRPLALVVGSEGGGMSRLVAEHCDFVVRLPMRGRVSSLNAAVAGSIVLYEAWRQRARKHGAEAERPVTEFAPARPARPPVRPSVTPAMIEDEDVEDWSDEPTGETAPLELEEPQRARPLRPGLGGRSGGARGAGARGRSASAGSRGGTRSGGPRGGGRPGSGSSRPGGRSGGSRGGGRGRNSSGRGGRPRRG